MGRAYVECALYVIVSRRHEQPTVSQAVLCDALLPFVQRALTDDDDDVSDALLKQAGQALAVIDRHIAAGLDAGAQLQTVDSAASFFSPVRRSTGASGSCALSRSSARRRTRNSGAPSTTRRPGSGARRKSKWARVEELLMAMLDKRT